MFVLDPAKRPSALDCLNHDFLRNDYLIDDETVRKFNKAKDNSLENPNNLPGSRFESKSTEKTYASNISESR